MILLAFVLECAAVGAIVATVGSLAVFAFSGLLRAMAPQVSAALRADLTLLLSLLPGIATLGIVAATVLPPLLSAVGIGAADDCFSDVQHGHLCLVHLGAPRTVLVALGAGALGLFALRAFSLAARWLRARSDVAELERLGRSQEMDFPIVWVPGAPRLCLATGVVRRRILISSSMADVLSPGQLHAALAHERAHLRRCDPLASVVVQLGSLSVLPWVAGFLARAHSADTEEVCDQDAAREVGEPALVAEALVKVAALASQRGPALAFGRENLETRVRALLRLSLDERVPMRLPRLIAGGLGLASTLGIFLGQSPAVHHAVEMLLHDFL